MNKKLVIPLITLCALFGIHPIFAIDNPHFWRATNFLPAFYEPRLSYPWLSTFDASLGYGATSQGRNGAEHKVPLLDIYGTYNMQALGINVPGKDLINSPGDMVLNQLALLPENGDFAHLSFNGTFKIIEANLSYSQNFDCGFFFQAHLPIRHLKISDISYTDLSPIDGNPNRSNPVWQNFLALFPSILAHYNLSIDSRSKTGVGDLSTLIGWTNNYENTQEIDYIDTTVRLGVLFPTGKKKNENQVFDIALGYNGHFAVPASISFAVGWYDWFTLGGHFGAMAFFKKTHELRMRTDCFQQGLIILATGYAQVRPGTLWEANAYVKADHFMCGISLLLGYSFVNKTRDTITPENVALFNPSLVNQTEQYLGWKMHTLQLMADIDLATHEHPYRPYIGAFVNFVVGGRRIFNTTVGGIYTGVNFVYKF